MSGYDERLLLPRNVCAKAFGVSVQAFDQWDVQPVEKRGRESLFYLPEVIAWRLNRDQGGEDGSLNLQAEKARLASAQADKTEIEVEILKGKVFRAESVEKAWTDMIGNCRARMLTIPTKLAPIMSAEKDQKRCESKLRDAIYEALFELKDYEPTQYSDVTPEAGDADDSAAAEADPERVGGHGKKTK